MNEKIKNTKRCQIFFIFRRNELCPKKKIFMFDFLFIYCRGKEEPLR